MKKISFILLFAAAIIGFNSCEYHGEPCKFNKSTIYLEVKQSQWQFDETSQQFYVRFNVKDITNDVYNYGNYTVTREFYTGKKEAFQVALPQSTFMTDTLTDNSVVYYTQMVDYRIGVGYIELQVTNSDYAYFKDNLGYWIKPEDMMFHLQLTY